MMHELPPPSQPVQQPTTPPWRQAVDNPWLVVPLLWMSRGFTKFWKVVLTIAVTAWTALILWFFWLIMVWCVDRIAGAITV
jgi:hypothetical protein